MNNHNALDSIIEGLLDARHRASRLLDRPDDLRTDRGILLGQLEETIFRLHNVAYEWDILEYRCSDREVKNIFEPRVSFIDPEKVIKRSGVPDDLGYRELFYNRLVTLVKDDAEKVEKKRVVQWDEEADAGLKTSGASSSTYQ